MALSEPHGHAQIPFASLWESRAYPTGPCCSHAATIQGQGMMVEGNVNSSLASHYRCSILSLDFPTSHVLPPPTLLSYKFSYIPLQNLPPYQLLWTVLTAIRNQAVVQHRGPYLPTSTDSSGAKVWEWEKEILKEKSGLTLLSHLSPKLLLWR